MGVENTYQEKKKKSGVFFCIKCYYLTVPMKIHIPGCYFDPFYNC